MNTIARAYIPAHERQDDADEYREMQVLKRANEIINSPEMLDEAVGDFGNAMSFTGLYFCLSAMARCESISDYVEQGRYLKHHLKTIALWKAERDEPQISVFLRPQAGEGEV